MKRIYLPFIMLLTVAYAQAQIELKPTIGINITNVSKDPDTGEAKGQAGFQFGASLLIGEKFYVEPGLFFAKKSTKFVDSGTQSEDIKLNMNGIRVPVAVGLHLLGDEETTAALRIFGGASAFFVTGVDAEGADKSDFSSPAWGVFAGAGLDVWILFLDLKYEWSLTDVASVTDFDLGKQKGLYANVGIRLRF